MSVQRQVRRLTSRGAVKGNWFESPWRIAGRAVSSAVVFAVIVLLLAIVVVPRIMGGDSFTVLSGSMEPTFAPGDVVVAKGISEGEVCTDISVGTIVTFFPTPNDPTLITHRVVGKTIGTFDDGTKCRLITQGDANSSVDEPISPAQVRGVFMYGIPKLGWARQWVTQNTMLVVGIAIAALVIGGIWSSFKRPRTTVMTVPRPANSGAPGAGAPGSNTPPLHAAAQPMAAQAPARDQALVERELELRERELSLRERELAFAMQRAPQAASRVHSDPDPESETQPRAERDPDPEFGSEAVPQSEPQAVQTADPSVGTDLPAPEHSLGAGAEVGSPDFPTTKRIEA